MTQCIKCGRNIPDGELFCNQCSKLPVIAELNNATLHPMADGRKSSKKEKKPTPAVSNPSQPAKRKNRLKVPFIIICVLLAACIGLLLWQESTRVIEENRLRTQQRQLDEERDAMEETDRLYAKTKMDLQEAEQKLKEKESELKELSARLAQSQSTQNQGQYDLEQKAAQMTALQLEHDTLKEQYDVLKEEHDTLVEALEAAAKYKEKAQFLDKYVVFVENNGTRHYHKYDCEDFIGSSFWTYSPKLAQAQGFTACPKCN